MEHNWNKYFDTTSEYWTKLQTLYAANEHYPKVVVGNRNLHHKFLRCLSKLENENVDNDDSNLVSLSLGDHFLAHYYLWKCTRIGYRRYTSRPVVMMYKKCVTKISDATAESIAQDWNAMNVAWNKGKKHGPMPDEHKRKISTAKKGKKHGPMSKEAKAKMSAAKKGKHWKLVDGKRVYY